MKQFFRNGAVVLLIAFFFQPQATYAQTVKAGDVVYFKISRVGETRYYFTSPVYIIATVKSVIGSSAILDTEMYLYKCKRDDRYWQTQTSISICKRYGVGCLYDTWRASRNKGYRWAASDLKKYTSSVEKQITGGRLRSYSESCTLIAEQ